MVVFSYRWKIISTLRFRDFHWYLVIYWR